MDQLKQDLSRLVDSYRKGALDLTQLLTEVEALVLGSYGEDAFGTISEPFSHLSEIDADSADRNYELTITEAKEVNRLVEEMLNSIKRR